MKMQFLGLIASAFLSGCSASFYTPSYVPDANIVRLADANGVPTWAVIPDSYKEQVPSQWVIYNHGFGQDIDSLLTHPPQSTFVESLSRAGFVVIASQYRDLGCWGNTDCSDDVANLQTLWRSKLMLAPHPFVVAESMGGIVTWNAMSHGALRPRAVVAIYPVCSLAAMYANQIFAPSIQTAYKFSDPADYSASTSSFDPLLTPPAQFTGIPIQIWASYSDHIVERSQNADVFAHNLSLAGGNATIHTSHGDHGDMSNFDASSVISFFRTE